jgi:hypothetical protein
MSNHLPSFLETILSGLSALKALKPLKKVTLASAGDTVRIQLIILVITMQKSRIFHGSLK